MRLLIPFGNEVLQLCTQVIFRFKIHDGQALALNNSKPLLHLIHLGLEPDMLGPGFQMMRGQNPAHRSGGDRLDDPLRHKLPGEFGAIPRGEATAQQIGALAGQAYHMDRDLGGKTALGSAARGIKEPIQAPGQKPPSPLADDSALQGDRACRQRVGVPVAQQEGNASPAYQAGCQRSKVARSLGDKTIRMEDLRPRAMVISFLRSHGNIETDTGRRAPSQANLDSFSRMFN